MRMRRILLPSVACPALPYFFSHYLTKGTFWKKIIEHKISLLILSTNLSEKFLILRRTERDNIISGHCSSRKIPAILVRF